MYTYTYTHIIYVYTQHKKYNRLEFYNVTPPFYFFHFFPFVDVDVTRDFVGGWVWNPSDNSVKASC